MTRNETRMTTVRHFTATGFVVHQDATLLHWHRKVKMWLPPGGHIEPNEDPVQAVLREVEEETGVRAEVVPTGTPIDLEYPEQVHAPFTIEIEDIDDPVQGWHQHIDMIYFCKPIGTPGVLNDGWRWVCREDLASGKALDAGHGDAVPPPRDVRVLAAHAFAVVGNE
ncbi:MAG: NUDIX domain-containing protein [Chloroflexi bacterium]|nr:NUDIX domain-containing protein [Chloroflexota bacterium]